MAPTHRITFTPADGSEPLVFSVRLVTSDPIRRRDYHDEAPVHPDLWWSWTREGAGFAPAMAPCRGWTCGGAPTPRWVAGAVRVEAVDERWKPSEAAWRYGGPGKDLIAS